MFLKSADSYESAKETERDVLTCDENGFAQTKDMPYGIYTVRQTSGWEGRELMKDFDVFISKDGQTYRYLINNANFESYIKIVKKDVETGNTIPYAGAGFQIYDPNGNLVTMTFTYPEVTTIDTFYTTADGDLIVYDVLHHSRERYGNIVWSVITQSHREICLCIGINQQDFFTLLHQTYTQIDRCGCFSDTAFLVSQSNHFAI